MPSPVPFDHDPDAADFSAQAHAIYDRMREADPVHWASRTRQWMVTRHTDARTVLRHPGLVAPDVGAYVEHTAGAMGVPLPALRQLVGEAVMLQSPPGHAQARRFMARLMNSKPMAESAPVVAAIVSARIEALCARGGGDLVTDFARAVPLDFMGAWLGVPAEEMAFLADCAEDVILVLERTLEADRCVEINSRVALGVEHLAGLCVERHAAPRDDGLSRLLELAKTEPALDDRVLATRAFFLFIAGLDTTTTFLSRAMLVLLKNDCERERWQRGEVSEATAVEELLRYTSPVAQVIREATEDVEFGERRVMRGQRIAAVIEAANRDPAVFVQPHRLDLGRAVCPHLAFGDGIHACLGATSARMQGAIALREFVRLPKMHLVDAPTALRLDLLQSLKTIPFTFVR